MKDERLDNSENNDNNKAMVCDDTGGAEVRKASLPSTSSAVMYSTLVLSALLLFSTAVSMRILTTTIGRESERTAIALEIKCEKTTATLGEFLRVLAKDAPPAGNSAAVGVKQAAAGQRALEMGKKAIEAGQTDKALLYFINGVNHDPSRMELVQNLADVARQSGSTELAERALGVLELATMQVAPDDMSTILDQIAELREKYAPSPVPKLSPEAAGASVQEIYVRYAPDAIWFDGAKVASGLSEIEFFQQMIDVSRTNANDDRYTAAISESVELAASLQRIQGSLPFYQHISNCVAQLTTIVNGNAPDAAYFASVSASAQGVLAQIWGGGGRTSAGDAGEVQSFS